MPNNPTVWIAPAVKAALAARQPVVALESTIISHGLPWPANADLALELQAMARDQGVVPATVGVIAGQLKVGLSEAEIRELAERGPSCLKLSRYDLPWAQAHGSYGATTVAGTMHLAAKAGIQVFATGGIGGVHRDHHLVPDISHDLEALSRERMIVVSAGAKAILDLPATLEYLETKGVLVVGYQTSQFPAFYYRDSGLSLPYCAQTAHDIAKVFSFVDHGSLLVANPIAATDALPRDQIEAAITRACMQAQRQGVSGKALTPFLLAALDQDTAGRSMVCNLQLVRNNLRLACEIAGALTTLPA